MDILIILLLVLFAIFLVVVEALLLPGVTIAAVGALASGIYASVLTAQLYGFGAGVTVFMVALVLSMITMVICIRKKNLSKISLKVNSDSVIPSVRESVMLGAHGVTSTRLAPMGTIIVDGNFIEAKSVGGFVDQKIAVKVIGYEDNMVLVEKINQ